MQSLQCFKPLAVQCLVSPARELNALSAGDFVV